MEYLNSFIVQFDFIELLKPILLHIKFLKIQNFYEVTNVATGIEREMKYKKVMIFIHFVTNHESLLKVMNM